LFLTALVVLPPALVKAESKTIVVPDDYSTIKDAIFYANEGDTVYVKKGTYQESNLMVDKAISVIGEDRESTIIIGQANSFMVLVNHSQVTISGLTLIASSTKQPTVSTIQYQKEIVTIQIEQAQNCNISGNKIENSGNGVWLHSSSNNLIEGNTILDNFYGIDITGYSTHNFIRNNDIISSQVGIRFSDKNANNNIVSANNITSAYTGLFYYFSSQNYVVGNYIAFNNDATHFVGSQSNVFHHNNFVDNLRDISKDSSYYDIRIVKSFNFWDDGREGNYWRKYFDYWSKNGVGNNGIGTLPYELNEFNKDNYPLLELVNIESYASYASTTLPYPIPTQPPTISPKPSPTSIPSPTQSSIPTLQPTANTGSQINYSLNPLVYEIGIIAIAIVSIAGLMVYFKKHKHTSVKEV
jgi:parallel beta-helix repeat protein